MSITPISPAINQQGWVQTWVTSRWKNPSIPGQFSAEINTQDYVTFGQLQSLLAELSQVPTGIMASLSGTTIPQGWVRANGQSLSRSAYPALWAFAQTSENLAASEEAKTAGQYGPGNGTTTFTVPNLEADGGYFLRPVASGRGIGSVQTDSLKEHTHTGSISPAGAHSHTYAFPQYLANTLQPAPGSGFRGELTRNTSTAPNHTHGLTINPTGGTETRPKNISYVFIIKA